VVAIGRRDPELPIIRVPDVPSEIRPEEELRNLEKLRALAKE
jgi:hypothetical protein